MSGLVYLFIFNVSFFSFPVLSEPLRSEISHYYVSTQNPGRLSIPENRIDEGMARRLVEYFQDHKDRKTPLTVEEADSLQRFLDSDDLNLNGYQDEVREIIRKNKAFLEAYEVSKGVVAANALKKARAEGDVSLLLSIAHRYRLTKAGREAMRLLASHYLERAKPWKAASYFDRLLEEDTLEGAALFKAAYAYQWSGDKPKFLELSKKLEPWKNRGRDGRFHTISPKAQIEYLRKIAVQKLDSKTIRDEIFTHDKVKQSELRQVWRNSKERIPKLPEFHTTAVSVGDFHSCAIRSRKAVCWGDNGVGEATPPKHFNNVTAISSGGAHTCAISDGKPVCWGGDGSGQSTPPKGLKNVTAISSGGGHTCAVSEGKPVCWGYNKNGRTTPPKGLKSVTAVSSGGGHTCAISEGKLTCWGWNRYGQATPPKDLKNVTAISSGRYHSCAISDGKPVCWGKNVSGMIVPPKGLKNVTAISAGDSHSCAVSDGKPICWGWNRYGQATPPNDLKNVTAISSGRYHSCAISDGKPVCWGANERHQSTAPKTPMPEFLSDLL